MDQHTGTWLDMHSEDVLDRFQLTDGHQLEVTTNIAFSTYSMTFKLQSTLKVSRIE